ncbi:glycoside hydrolase family 99-like domain-containing protein [Sphingobium sp. WCS2017Hpa-17]|uniref:glycoside hydrolase family 99-like domain-containing protein n=1 Tax=Sphingobium sp. WCS2017Hpa-17 TaxID=3073638 RepID=UPI00288BA34F|nr:glycoside hydrolase family 99-like domain-containing protein [Sphingobium sp. WCS2017Hpa-17]
MLNFKELAKEIDQSGLFDQKWYVENFPDAGLLDIEPLEHFVRFGLLLKRDPGPGFDTRHYMDTYPDVPAAGMHALVHYVRFGKSEGRQPLPPMAKLAAVAPTATAPEGVTWVLRHATDAFGLRGLEPHAPLAVIVNIVTSQDGAAMSALLGRIPAEFDLFLLGGTHNLNVDDLPSSVRSLTLLGDADEAGNARGFTRLAGSGALDGYVGALWLSPQDAAGPLTDDDIARLIGLHGAFCADPQWGVAGDRFIRLDRADPAHAPLVAALNTVLPRLGLLLGQAPLDVPAGWGLWFKPFLSRVLGVTMRLHEMTANGAGGKFPGRASVLAMLSAGAREAALDVRPAARTLPAAPADRVVKAVAFYLPQFHPIPENNTWWGKGFTEWSNVARGRPLFRHHYQPRLPADLGYYDLRLEDTQVAQADLARQFGIHGFCFYYYWFNGKKLLNHPIEQMAKSSRIDTGFCVCWANENWSRNWDGQNRHVLMEQQYSLESNIAFIHEMIPMMKDPRWIRYCGKPVLVVYRISIIPNWMETARIWREECRKAGLGEIHLCAVRFGLETLGGQPQDHGIDSYVLFPPHEGVRVDLRDKVHDRHKDFGGEIFDYNAVADGDVEKYVDGYEWPVHRGAMLGWDNTARRLTDARIFTGATPYGFRRWMKGILDQDNRHNPAPETMMFINAWNEWAEGTYLEPDQRWGLTNLAAFQSAAEAVPGLRPVTLPQGVAAQPKAENRLAYLGSPLNDAADMPRGPVWYRGFKEADPSRPTILLCAHISGHQLFGGERSLLDVLEALAKMPVNVVMTLPSDNNRDYIKRIQKLCMGAYAFRYPQWMDKRAVYAWLALDFADIIARHAVDIVHANTIVLLEPIVAARRMGRIALTHVRELISLDEGLQERMNQTTGEIVSAVFGNTDWLIGNSRATCELFARGDRTLYVPNAISAEDFEMRNVFGNGIKFGIVSSNIPKKGIADFVEVARLAAARTDRAKFVIIGPRTPQIDIWMEEVARGERPDNLVFAGYKDSARAAMIEVNVLLNLSTFAESFGRTVAEAMAARRPVIAYRWGALPELVQHGETGYMVPFRDIDGVVDAVVDLCAHDDKIGVMGEKGHAFITSNFSQARLGEQVMLAYERICGRPMRADAAAAATAKAPLAISAQTIGAALPTTIIIPVYNAPEEVRACITSVLKHTDLRETQVLVIDDGSPDPAIAPLLDSFVGIPGLTIQRSPQNQGYTRTINMGIAQAAGRDVVLLNSDTIVTPKWLEGLRATAYSRPQVGTVTAMGDNAGAFSFPVFNQKCEKPAHLGHEEYALAMVQGAFGCTPPEVPTGSGFCLFIRRAMMDLCGTFDEEGFPRGYGEENDFCLRGMKAGWANLVSPWAFVFHVRTASFKGEKDELIKAGVDVVTKRYPDYAPMVKAAFAAPDMMALREATGAVVNGLTAA